VPPKAACAAELIGHTENGGERRAFCWRWCLTGRRPGGTLGKRPPAPSASERKTKSLTTQIAPEVYTVLERLDAELLAVAGGTRSTMPTSSRCLGNTTRLDECCIRRNERSRAAGAFDCSTRNKLHFAAQFTGRWQSRRGFASHWRRRQPRRRWRRLGLAPTWRPLLRRSSRALLGRLIPRHRRRRHN
jgi:hypothetical protein